MTDVELSEFVSAHAPDDEVLLADGFEDAFIGLGWQFNKPLACYDRNKCIEILVKRDSMTCDDAEEFFDTNVTGSYVGENTPVFISTPE